MSDDERDIDYAPDEPYGDWLWSTFMLARTVATADSIIKGKPVIARNLDPTALRRALRGAELPAPDEYVTVTMEMLWAIDEAGPFAVRA